MQIKELLKLLDLGNSVAEFDSDLNDYFVETQTFHAVVTGKVDIIAGDKGTGKTALYRVIRNRYKTYKELSSVEILPAFNPQGNPIFQSLGQLPSLNEGQYITIWKSYLLSLIGNWLLEQLGDSAHDKLKSLEEVLKKTGLRSLDDSAQTIFSKIINTFKRFLNPKSAEMGIAFSEAGIPVFTPKFEFESNADELKKCELIPHEETFKLLNECLKDLGLTVWIMLDRLDEAFQGYPAIEKPALRALLRTYLDLLEFEQLKIKLFVRKDLFRKVVQGGFVNLTHINAKRLDIIWDEEDLRSLLCKRVRRNMDFISRLGVGDKSDQELFSILFPDQVDIGPRKPKTWAWMMSRIRDGNNIKPPRNLIDLAKKAHEAQQRVEERLPREYSSHIPLIEAESIRKALQKLSEDRVQDTLLAEAMDLAPVIEKFQDGKAEHNVTSLSRILGVPESDVKVSVKPLVEMGFLEEIGESYKVPMLYRDGLQITQGKAFSVVGSLVDSDSEIEVEEM